MIMSMVGDMMGSRMDRYYENQRNIGTRAKRNEQLYQEISQGELENVNLSSNAHVIGDNDIDIDHIKELLEKQYPKEEKRTSIFATEEESKLETPVQDEETKEYDINAILEKAKSTKEVNYERDRLKKIHDTQYDILKSLDVNEDKEEEKSKVISNKDDLVDLIHTITEKEMQKDLDPLDILSDLKGSENTVVLDGIDKEIEKKELHNTVKEEIKKEIDKSFYTNSLSFTQSDFDDFNDLKEDVESNKLIVRVLLVIVAIALVVGMIFLINAVFHFNWF